MPGDDTGGLDTDTLTLAAANGSGAVDGVAQSVDDAAEELIAYEARK